MVTGPGNGNVKGVGHNSITADDDTQIVYGHGQNVRTAPVRRQLENAIDLLEYLV